MTPRVEPQVRAKKRRGGGPMAPRVSCPAGASLPFLSLPGCSGVPTTTEGGPEPSGRNDFSHPSCGLVPPCRLQGASTICRHLHLEGGGSVATGNSGFLKSSQGIWNFIIRSLQSSRHPGVGSVFSAFCVLFFFFFLGNKIFSLRSRGSQ